MAREKALTEAQILEQSRRLAVEYYRLVGKPIDLTQDIAEQEAVRLLGLERVRPHADGYDALRGTERIQIRGLAVGDEPSRAQRVSKVRIDLPCDTFLLVLIDRATLLAREIWQAPFAAVVQLLARPRSKSVDNTALNVGVFRAVAKRVWRDDALRRKRKHNICPECGHVFAGNGWVGLDAHWTLKHAQIMPYVEARPLILNQEYVKKAVKK